MCGFILRTYGCDPSHKRYIASNWCPEYSNTQKRCSPLDLAGEEVFYAEKCGDCKETPPVVWEYMIKRKPTPKPRYFQKVSQYYQVY